MSFSSQVKNARAKSINENFSHQVLVSNAYSISNIGNAVETHDVTYLSQRLGNKDFDNKMTLAYAKPEGYYIARNPETGEVEMFVAGTRTADQWAGNAYDALAMGFESKTKDEYDKIMHMAGVPRGLSDKLYTPYDKSLLYRVTRGRKENELARVARENNVDVVYGHSRGGALVADAPFDDHVTRVGVDSAMIIAKNKDMINLNEGGGSSFYDNFDALIGMSGHDNVTVNLGSNVHHAWN